MEILPTSHKMTEGVLAKLYLVNRVQDKFPNALKFSLTETYALAGLIGMRMNVTIQ